jgi:hypothetical protein
MKSIKKVIQISKSFEYFDVPRQETLILLRFVKIHYLIRSSASLASEVFYKNKLINQFQTSLTQYF